MAEEESKSGKPKRRKGRGYLIAFLVVVVLVAVACIFVFKVPERLGLVEPPAERLLDTTPNREATAVIIEDLEQAGVYTQGVQIYVFPFKDREGSVALVILDASQGFNFASAGDDSVMGYLSELATGEAAQQYGIEQVAFDYRDESGESLVTVTAPTEAISGFVGGSINQEEYMREVDIDFNLQKVSEVVQEVLQ